MHRSRLIISCLVFGLITACGQHGGSSQPTPTPSGPAAAVQTNTYQGVGIVKSLNLKRPGIEIDHEDIVGLMPAMQMEFPVTESALLTGVAVHDRIDFTIRDGTGEMTVIAIKKK